MTEGIGEWWDGGKKINQKNCERICIFSLVVMTIATYIAVIDRSFMLNMDDIVGMCVSLVLGGGKNGEVNFSEMDFIDFKQYRYIIFFPIYFGK